MKYRYRIPDYEHSGDLRYGEQEIRKTCPEVTSLVSFEERNYEAEEDYKSDYGYSEPIYQGYIEFEAPSSYVKKFRSMDVYPI